MLKRSTKQDALMALGAEQNELGADYPSNIPPDYEQRDQILQTALTWLDERGFKHLPMCVEDDIATSYCDDSLEDFRKTVRGWLIARTRHERNQ